MIMGQSSSVRMSSLRERLTFENIRIRRSPRSSRTNESREDAIQLGASAANKDLVKPFQKWLSMEEKLRYKHIQHARNCILSPFLFKRKNDYSEKILSWLRDRELLPKSRNLECLSDKHIEVADYAEECADLILTSMTTEGFLYDVAQVTEQLKECQLLSDVLRMAEDSELVKLIWQCSTHAGHLTQDDVMLVLMSVLDQALAHVEMASDSTFNHLEHFEHGVGEKAEVCEGLRLRGNHCFQKKQFKEACKVYSEAISLRPFDPVLYGNRAQSYLNNTQYREALSDARRAICLNPSWEKGYFRYAKAYYQLGYHEKAIAVNSHAQTCCIRTKELKHQAELFVNGTRATTSSVPSGSKPSNERSAVLLATRGEKSKKAKLGEKESRRSSPNTKRKRLDSSGRHMLSACTHNEFDGMPELVSDSDDDNNVDRNSDHQSTYTPQARATTANDSLPVLVDDSDDDWHHSCIDSDTLGCTCEDCVNTISPDTESLPATLSESSFSDCCDDIHEAFLEDGCGDMPDLESSSDLSNHGSGAEERDDADDADDHHADTESFDGDEPPFMNPFGALTFHIPPPNPTELFIGGALVLDLIRQFLEAHPEMDNDDTPSGALPEVIESLTRMKITKEQLDRGSSCCICQCDFELDEEAACLPCQHTYHLPCIGTWLKMHATCPTCRDVLPH